MFMVQLLLFADTALQKKTPNQTTKQKTQNLAAEHSWAQDKVHISIALELGHHLQCLKKKFQC